MQNKGCFVVIVDNFDSLPSPIFGFAVKYNIRTQYVKNILKYVTTTN